MDAKEFEIALNDLETRVDRLRALYENWFRGYEKLEPQIARKDVERRVYGLRKELPRNTALRFRYHQLYQRYTTLTNYWQRTARQIEEGTFRLQLQRLKRKKERLEPEALGPEGEAADKERDDDRMKPRSYELDLDESLNVGDLLDELEMDAVAKAVDTPGPHSEPPPALAPAAARASATFAKPKRSDSMAPRARRPALGETPGSSPPPSQLQAKKPSRWDDDELDAPTGLHLALDDVPSAPRTPQTPSAKGALPGTARPSLADAPARAAVPRTSLADGAPAAHPLPGAPGAGAKLPAAPLPASPLAAGLKPTPGAMPAKPAPTASSGSGAKPVPPPALGGAAAPAAPGTSAGRPAPTAPLGTQGARPAPTAPTGTSGARPAPGVPGAPGARPAPAAPTGTASMGAPAARPAPPPLAQGARPAPAGAPPPVPAQSGGTFVGRPPMRSPITGGGPSGPDLNEQRMRRIYDEYVAARRKNNEGDVRYEALVTSINKMLPELKKKHEGKQIDFEVVVKDGRVGLKPKPT